MESLHSFSRREIKCDSVLCSLFGINDVECRAFFLISSKGEASLEQIAESLGKDKSTTHRCLEKLVSLRLCFKESHSLAAGGHKNIYSAAKPRAIRDDALKILETFYSTMKEKVLYLDEYIEMEIKQLP